MRDDNNNEKGLQSRLWSWLTIAIETLVKVIWFVVPHFTEDNILLREDSEDPDFFIILGSEDFVPVGTKYSARATVDVLVWFRLALWISEARNIINVIGGVVKPRGE